MATTHDQLCQAVKSHLSIAFSKDGDPHENPRIGEPHLVFLSTTGKAQVAIFQTAGYSSSGKLPQWRNFDVDTITLLTVLQTAFVPRADFNRQHSMYAQLICG